MKQIALDVEGKKDALFAEVDDRDFEHFNAYKWKCEDEYAVRLDRGRNQSLHCAIAEFMGLLVRRDLEASAERLQVEHVDGNRRNNQRKNLRMANYPQHRQTRDLSPDERTRANVVLNELRSLWLDDGERGRAIADATATLGLEFPTNVRGMLIF